MTTTYYTFQTRKVKVSGGPDLLSLVPVAHTEAQQVPAEGKVISPKAFGGALPQDASKAEILDFDFCRRHMETKSAWKALTQAATEEEEQQSEEELWEERWESVDRPEAQAARGFQVSERLELIASGAVILTALSAAAAFLSLL